MVIISLSIICSMKIPISFAATLCLIEQPVKLLLPNSSSAIEKYVEQVNVNLRGWGYSDEGTYTYIHAYIHLYSSWLGPILFSLKVIWTNLQSFSIYTSGGGYVAGQGRRLTSSGGYLDNLPGRLCEFWIFENYCTLSFQPEIWTRDPWIWKQCSSTELSSDLYVKGGDNVFNATGRTNEIGQRWCPVYGITY